MDKSKLADLKVLVVDDNDHARLAVTTILSALDVASIVESADGENGLQALRHFPADIVICDWNMPSMPGADFLRAVRSGESPADPDLPFLMLTGNSGMDRVVEARDTGATGYIVKPVTAAVLVERIARVMENAGDHARGAAAAVGESRPDRDDEGDACRAIREKIKGTGVNEQALLATDYLNHFNEVMMMLEMAGDFPEVIERAKEWRPKSYVEHFRDSNLSEKDIIIEAYEHAPSKYRVPFDETVAELNGMVRDGIRDIEAALASDDRDRSALVAADIVETLRDTMSRANGIIHGTVPTMAQDEIDALFD